MLGRSIGSVVILLLGHVFAYGQSTSAVPDKVSHAEPLYSDLVRDLGARKGEKEWNVGISMEDKLDYCTASGLVEYEFAPANRLGVEIEIPFSAHFRTNRNNKIEMPQNGFNGIKVAAQYTFLVSRKHNLSLAAGYCNDFEFHMEKISNALYWAPENAMHPFFVAAKSWKTHYHTLLYTGPSIRVDLRSKKFHPEWIINTNFHYMFTGTKNFVGIEINQHISPHGASLVLRPQVRIAVSAQVAMGFVAGFPLLSKDEGVSMFCRLIYEPKRPNSKTKR